MHYQGSCHCGAVRFSFEAEPIKKGLRCNCSLCMRKGAMMSPIPIPERHFHIEADENAVGLYQFGEKTAFHYFCKHCGIYPFHIPGRFPGTTAPILVVSTAWILLSLRRMYLTGEVCKSTLFEIRVHPYTCWSVFNRTSP